MLGLKKIACCRLNFSHDRVMGGVGMNVEYALTGVGG
jgi:hypothetical protein